MATRRSHQKSRHGCSTCKRRRVKCDEKRPHCQNCTQRNDTCVYIAPVPFAFAGKPERLARSSTKTPDSAKSSKEARSSVDSYVSASGAKAGTAPLNLEHMELELQWILHTHKLFARNEETRKVWEIPVLQEALYTPFLMHGILAISALHLAHLRQDERQTEWLKIAIAHKSTALAVFSEQLHHIDESNARAMISFASIAVVFSFASALHCPDSNDGPNLDALIDILMLARGVQTIGSQATEFLRHSNFAPLYNIADPGTTVPDDVLTALRSLEDLNVHYSQQAENHDPKFYAPTIEEMRKLGPFTFAEPTSLTLIGGWAIRASPELLEGLKSREPFALVILAHFCVFLHLTRENWCIGPWGRLVLGEIVQILDSDWQRHIKWAVVQVLR
ncbi:Sterol uptake control protein 2 [Penicillium rolfsii]|nr:Sterol uptake control protein 2 [Penicillium rolfsii]